MGWAFVGASSLLIGALIAFAVRIGDRLLGFILAFGAGVLVSAVAYELVEEAVAVTVDSWAVGAGFALGAIVFYTGDVAIDRRIEGQEQRAHAALAEALADAIAIDGLGQLHGVRVMSSAASRSDCAAVTSPASSRRLARER